MVSPTPRTRASISARAEASGRAWMDLAARGLGGDERLGLAEAHEHEPHEAGGTYRLHIGPRSHRHSDGRDHPDGGGAREARDRPSEVQDGARADEADAGEDLGRDPAGVASARRDVPREHGEERGPHADEDVRAETRGLAAKLALEADGPAEDHGEHELKEELQAERPRQRVDDVGQGTSEI